MSAAWRSGASRVPRATWEDADRGPYSVIVSTVLLVLPTIFVLLRLVARRMKQIWGNEDWFCIAALVTLFAGGILNYIQIANGLGRHVQFVTREQQTVVLGCLLALEILYNITMVLVKFSLCCLYARLFPRLKRLVYVVGGFVTAWGLAFVLTLVFQCSPVPKFWEPGRPGTCLDPRPIFVANALLNFCSDIALLCLPITQVVQLEVHRSVKISVCSIFLLGGFVSASGLYRIKALLEVDPTDTTWTFVDSNIWTMVEMSCAVISATMPTLRPILAKISASFSSLSTRKGGSSGLSAVPKTRTQPTHNRLASTSTISLTTYDSTPMQLGRQDSQASQDVPESLCGKNPAETTATYAV